VQNCFFTPPHFLKTSLVFFCLAVVRQTQDPGTDGEGGMGQSFRRDGAKRFNFFLHEGIDTLKGEAVSTIDTCGLMKTR